MLKIHRNFKKEYENLMRGVAVNNNEKISNLQRMLIKGKITKEEYDDKMLRLE